MKKIPVLNATLALAVLVAVACVRPPAETEPAGNDAAGAARADSSASSAVLVRQTGGIAALEIVQRIERAGDVRWSTRTGRLCGSSCPPATDSAGGPLAAPLAARAWAAARAAGLDTLRADYGSTRGAADMMDVAVRDTTSSGTRTFRGDEGTLPPALKALTSEVASVIRDARGSH